MIFSPLKPVAVKGGLKITPFQGFLSCLPLVGLGLPQCGRPNPVLFDPFGVELKLEGSEHLLLPGENRLQSGRPNLEYPTLYEPIGSLSRGPLGSR